MTDESFMRAPATFASPRPGYRIFSHADFMAEERLRELGSEAEFVSVAHFESRRWIINTDGVASIVPRGDTVPLV